MIGDRVQTDMLATALAESFAKDGHPCLIEVSASGLIVYAASKVSAEHVAASIARTIRAVYNQASSVRSTTAQKDGAEPPETSWWAEVTFDARRL